VRSLPGKRILFIGTGFYDYEASIVTRLRRHHAVVDAFFDRPALVRGGPLAGRLSHPEHKAHWLIERHQGGILAAVRGSQYDFVLAIKGADLALPFLEALRQAQRGAEFILYLWDTLHKVAGIEERLPYFDRVLTFDRKDALARPTFQFRPLFYRDDIAPAPLNRGAAESIDLCFIGWLHSDRLPLMRRVQSLAEMQRMSVFLYLYTGGFTWLKLATKRAARDVHTRPLGYHKVMNTNQRARAILDFPHKDQCGITMRAIEAVGLGKKLLTTATDIVNYDFYSADNIRLLESDDLKLDPAFVRSPATPLPEQIRLRYSLDSWLAEVFGVALNPS
jgi:hypothetical protein